jgi:hypothetical protein
MRRVSACAFVGWLVVLQAGGCAALTGLDSIQELDCAPNCGADARVEGDAKVVDQGTGDGSPPGADGADAPPDATQDVSSRDAPGDTSQDVSNDTSQDVAADVSADAPVNDAPSDAGADAGPEAGGDATADARPDGPSVLNGLAIFVSSALYDGNLGGLSGADATCQTLAQAAGLSGSFRAWLSDSNTSASQRLSHGTLPYVLVDNTVVAIGWTGLTSGTLLHAIDLTETGQAPTQGSLNCSGGILPVWTFTTASGGLPGSTGANCADWTSSADQLAYGGLASSQTSSWSAACSIGAVGLCAKTASIYCVQQ